MIRARYISSFMIKSWMRVVLFLIDLVLSNTNFRLERRSIWHPWIPRLGGSLARVIACMCLISSLLFQLYHHHHPLSFHAQQASQGGSQCIKSIPKTPRSSLKQLYHLPTKMIRGEIIQRGHWMRGWWTLLHTPEAIERTLGAQEYSRLSLVPLF